MCQKQKGTELGCAGGEKEKGVTQSPFHRGGGPFGEGENRAVYSQHISEHGEGRLTQRQEKENPAITLHGKRAVSGLLRKVVRSSDKYRTTGVRREKKNSIPKERGSVGRHLL